jgi:hypothetical protein
VAQCREQEKNPKQTKTFIGNTDYTEKDYLDAQKTQRIGNGRWCNSPVTYLAVSGVCHLYMLYMSFLSSSVSAMAAGLAPGNFSGCVPNMFHIRPIFPCYVPYLSFLSDCAVLEVAVNACLHSFFLLTFFLCFQPAPEDGGGCRNLKVWDCAVSKKKQFILN